jgi:hypothetical protein
MSKEKDLQYFLEEVAKELKVDFDPDSLTPDESALIGMTILNDAKDRFHAHQINELQGQNEALTLKVYELTAEIEIMKKCDICNNYSCVTLCEECLNN